MKNVYRFFLSGIIFSLMILVSGFYRNAKQSPMVVLHSSNMDILYIGLDNPVSISASGVDIDNVDVTVSAGNATIRPDTAKGKGNYLVMVNDRKLVELSVREKQDSKKIIRSFQFRPKGIPDPLLFVGHHCQDDSATVDELHKELGIFTRMCDFDFVFRFQAVSFAMAIIKDGKCIELNSESANFTDEMKKEISLLNKGDKIFFYNVKAKGINGEMRNVLGLSLKIK